MNLVTDIANIEPKDKNESETHPFSDFPEGTQNGSKIWDPWGPQNERINILIQD